MARSQRWKNWVSLWWGGGCDWGWFAGDAAVCVIEDTCIQLLIFETHASDVNKDRLRKSGKSSRLGKPNQLLNTVSGAS